MYHSRNSAAKPLAPAAAYEVLDPSVYSELPAGNWGLQVPLPLKSAPVCGCAPDRCEPGARMSGLMRPSSVGPRAEKSSTSRALLAPVSGTPQPSVAPIGRTFSDAPTAIAFLAVPGELVVLPPGPEFPAETTSVNGWLPATPGCASRTIESNSCDRVSYAPPVLAPHELLDTRAPLA